MTLTEDWAAVAATIEEHMTSVGVNQRELAERAGVALSIVRELRHNTVQRHRNGRTLEAISVALDLHPRHLSAVAAGHPPPAPTDPTAATDQLSRIEARLDELATRMGAIDTKMAMIIDSVWPNQR
jgi:hypothetical protein